MMTRRDYTLPKRQQQQRPTIYNKQHEILAQRNFSQIAFSSLKDEKLIPCGMKNRWFRVCA
jgi:hypothetical protein